MNRLKTIKSCEIHYKLSSVNFNNLNLTDKSLLSLVGKSHMMDSSEERIIKSIANKYDNLG